MEDGKLFDLGIIVGRFQGVHRGHLMMIDAALSVCGEVGVFIGSSQESGTNKNPFSYDIRYKMLHRVYGDAIKIFPLPDAGLGNCAAWGEYVIKNVTERMGRAPELFVSGKEERRASWLEGDVGSGIAELYIPKTIDISASRMREFFVNGERESWKEYTPPGLWDMFDSLRAQVVASRDVTDTDSI
ncbi:MAG: adenylyltransferase/cytidyltransferase family protein [Clostridia bacterium]|nr:adenylyltransferase/cytidyltransferase family protein [Clostridia bacterium]